MEPPAKRVLKNNNVKRISPFKLISSMDALSILRWTSYASLSDKQLAGQFAIHSLLEMGQQYMVNEALANLGVTVENISNLEMGIVFIQHLLHLNEVEKAARVIEKLDNNGGLIRKRHVELVLHYYLKNQLVQHAIELIERYIIGRFELELEDIFPILTTEYKYMVLEWLMKQETQVYFDDNLFPIEEYPNVNIKKIPINTESVEQQLLRIYPDLAKSQLNMEFPVDYVVDGGNVLYSINGKSNPAFLYKFVQELRNLGTVAVILNCGNFKTKHKKHAAVNRQILANMCYIVETPCGINDDFFAIYMAMKHKAILVTNDLFRDHYNISPIIKLWHKEYSMSFDVDWENDHLVFSPPLPFSHRIQQVDNKYYCPTVDPYKWIVI